jgi:hypothetical protein
MGFTAAVSLLTGLLFSLAPALQSTKPALVTALKENSAGAGSRFSLRNGLVVVQVALSLLLVIGAGLFLRSLDSLRDIESGFRPDHTIIAAIDPSRNGYKGQRLREFYQRLIASAERIPGVQSVSLAHVTPLGGSRWNDSYAPEGYELKATDKKDVDMNAVGPRFFETMGIPLLAGREFRDEDNPATSGPPPTTFQPGYRPPSRAALRHREPELRPALLRGPQPRRHARDPRRKVRPAEAVRGGGGRRDVHYFGLRRDAEPMVYLPVWRNGANPKTLVLRTSARVAGTGDALRREVTAIDAAIPVMSLRTIEQQIDNNIMEDRLMTTLSGFFGYCRSSWRRSAFTA